MVNELRPYRSTAVAKLEELLRWAQEEDSSATPEATAQAK